MRYLWERLKETDKPIVLYGMGDGADRILDRMALLGISASGVFASNDFVRGHVFRGFPVITYAQAKEKYGDMIVLLAFGTNRPEVMERITRIAAEQEFYAPDVPVCGETFFTREYAQAHSSELDRVYGMLEDEESRKVFKSIVAYRLTGVLNHLTACESDKDEAYGLLGLGQNESYLDLGAYNGDTVLELIAHVGKYKSITAVEPDSRSFRKLVSNTGGLPCVTAINLGISNGESLIPFSAGSGRGSASKGSRREAMIPAASVDSIIGGEYVSYIKIDIEGREKAAITGGAETIRRCRPKMCISCYHRGEDIFELPLLVKSMVPDYRIYIRHHPYFPAWDTNYYFI